ncbi:ribonuclease H-like domain-containing protein [Tanacetum coccineum]
MWLFRYKHLAYGTLSHYKAGLVANGSTKLSGIDVDDTFSPVVKPDTIRTPSGFLDSQHPDYVCLLHRSLYVLKHASRAWFQRFAAYITRVSFSHSCSDSYLLIYRPDTAYLLLYIDDIVLTASSEPHFSALKRILRYVRGTLDYALQFYSSSPTFLVAYSDVDWAGFPITRRSTFGYCVFLDNNLISCSSKRQLTLSRSSVEVEYHGVANVVTETCWLRNLLREFHTPLSSATLVYCDNVSVLVVI